MKKIFLLIGIFLMGISQINAQIEVSKLIGKNSSDYSIGLGAFLKFAVPVSDAAAVSGECGIRYFLEKEYGDVYGLLYVPLKLGYRYTVNGSGSGFYVEPQLGYNLYGVKSYQSNGGVDVNEKFNGLVWAACTGYLFESRRRTQMDISLRFESVMYKNGPANSIALRLTNNFRFGRRE